MRAETLGLLEDDGTRRKKAHRTSQHSHLAARRVSTWLSTVLVPLALENTRLGAKLDEEGQLRRHHIDGGERRCELADVGERDRY